MVSTKGAFICLAHANWSELASEIHAWVANFLVRPNCYALVSTHLKKATNSNLHPPTGRVGRGSGRGGASGFNGNSVVDRLFALPARSSRPSRREGEERCVDTNGRYASEYVPHFKQTT